MKIKGLRWFIIGLIFLATVINYIDRSALGIMWGSEDDKVKSTVIDLLAVNQDSAVSMLLITIQDSTVSGFLAGIEDQAVVNELAAFQELAAKQESSVNLENAAVPLLSAIQESAVIQELAEKHKHTISQDLGLTKNHYGLILNVFMVFYALGQLFSGRLFDKVGTRIGYVISIGVWALSSFMHSTVRGLLSISVFRSLLGISEAGNWPGAVKSNAEWFPIKERAIAQGLFNAGASIGSVIAPPLIAAIFIAFGWRVSFMVIGSFGMLWIIPWLLINRAGPKKHPWMTDKEKKYILEGQSKADQESTETTRGKSLWKILSFRESWAVVVGRFFLEPIWWFFVGWMPIYLFNVYNFDVKQVGMFLWVPYVGAAIGSIAGGFISGRIISRTGSINKGRKTTIIVGGIIMVTGLIMTILFGKNPVPFVLIVSLVLFGFQIAIGNVQTLPSDFFSGKSVGTLAGLGGMVGVFSVIIMNILVPIIARTEVYTPIFIGIAIFVPLGVSAIYFFARKIRPLEDNE